MAKPVAAGGAPAPEKKGKKKTFKKKERKHVPHGLVHVQASFNNTIVTITVPAKERPLPLSRPRQAPPAWRAITAYAAWM
jgi:hypothetical protein